MQNRLSLYGMMQDTPPIGVAIVTYQSADVITGCLDSLLGSEGVALRMVIVDNASNDATVETLHQWALSNRDRVSFAECELGTGEAAEADVTLLRSPVNGGFAFGCNRALELLVADEAVQLFWLVNPDARVLPDTAAHFARAGADGRFSLMGGRTFFAAQPDTVQTDGGRVSRWTGQCESVNWGVLRADATMPAAEELDFITGANCVASRGFLETTGLMEEDYFLYYEEVDWAFRRGDLPLRVVPEAAILHLGGTAIGTGSIGRRPSPLANYFNYRNRMRFMRRFFPATLPLCLLHGLAKSVQLLLLGAGGEARALLAGLLGLAPTRQVRESFAPEACPLAFGRHAR